MLIFMMNCRRISEICFILLLNLTGLLLAKDPNALENHAQAVTESRHMNEPGEPHLPEQSMVTIAVVASHPVLNISPATQTTLSEDLSHATRNYTPAVTHSPTFNDSSDSDGNTSTTSLSNISSSTPQDSQSDASSTSYTRTSSPLIPVVTTITESPSSEYRTWQTTASWSQNVPTQPSPSSTVTKIPITERVPSTKSASATASPEAEGTARDVSVESTVTRHMTATHPREMLLSTTKKHAPVVSTTTVTPSTTSTTPVRGVASTSTPTTVRPTHHKGTPNYDTTTSTTLHSTSKHAVQLPTTVLKGTTQSRLPTISSSTKSPVVFTTPTTPMIAATTKSVHTTMANTVHTTAIPVQTTMTTSGKTTGTPVHITATPVHKLTTIIPIQTTSVHTPKTPVHTTAATSVHTKTPTLVHTSMDTTSVNTSPTLVNTSPTPVNTSPTPVNTSPTPVNTSPTPVNTSPTPAHTTKTPVNTSPTPLNTSPTPVNTSPTPVNTSPTPVNTSPTPVNTSPTPVNTSPTPVNTSPTPVNTSPTPLNTSPTPVNTSPTPVNTSPTPVNTSPTPVNTSPTPVNTSPTPVNTSPTPVNTSPTPVNTSPTPVNTSPTPVNTSPTPVNTSPTPVNTSPTPVNTSPTPVNTSPTPAHTTKTLVNTSPTPVNTSPTPVNTSPTPVNTSPTPVNTSPTPVNTSPTPVNTSPTPLNTSPTPVNTSPTPVNTSPTPVNTSPTPAHTTKTLVNTSPTPVNTSPTPVNTSPTPVNTSPTPVNTSPTPVNTSPTPVNTSPTPLNTSPTPVNTSPTPVNTSPTPVNTSPTPVNTSPTPVNTSPTPVNTSPIPVNTSPTPVNTSPTPVNTSPTPVNTSPTPVNTSPTPVHTTTASPIHTATKQSQTETQTAPFFPSTTKNRKPATTESSTPTSTPLLPSLQTLSTVEPVTANASYRLPAYVQLRLGTTWPLFCLENLDVLQSLSEYSRQVLKLSAHHRVSANYLNVQDKCRSVKVIDRTRRSESGAIPIDFYITVNESYYENSTRKVGADLVSDPSTLQQDVAFEITSTYVLVVGKPTISPTYPEPPEDRQGVVLGSTLTICALVFSVLMSAIGLKLYRKSRTVGMDRYYFDGKQLQDALSESHQMGGVSGPRGHHPTVGHHPAPTYREYFMETINRGFVLDEEDVFVEEGGEEETLPSHVLTDNALAKFYSYQEAIQEEFENLPGHNLISVDGRKKQTLIHHMSTKSCAPTTYRSPDKTKVPIATLSPAHEKQDCVLDASFIRGYASGHCSYIAARLSGEDSSDALWRTVWDQQSRTIICLCSPQEMGKTCPQYWPTKEGGQGAHLHGNLLVTMKGGASGEHYSTSSLLVRNVEKTLCRPVTHYWLSQWGEGGVPSSPHALMTMLLEIHNTHQESYGPVIIHCSDGVGRTGMVIATHINMQRLEDARTIDVPRTVSSIRQDRGHAVLNQDQYASIYKTLYDFSKFLSLNPGKETSDTESVLDNTDSTSTASYQDKPPLKKKISSSSSYLEDLSSSMKQRLALKFPNLRIGPHKQINRSRNRNSVVELVSPSTSPSGDGQDVLPASWSPDDREGNSSSSSLQSSLGHWDSRTQSEASFSSLNESTDQHCTRSTLYKVEETPSRDDSTISLPRPPSISVSRNRVPGQLRNAQEKEENLFSQMDSVDVSSVSITMSESNLVGVQFGATNNNSTGAKGLLVSNIELQGCQQDLDNGGPLSSCHVRQTSYPTDLNPFVPSLPSPNRPTNSHASYHQPTTCQPANNCPPFGNIPVGCPSSTPSHDELGTTRDISYPQNLNPFDALVENRHASSQRCQSVSAVSDNPFILVPTHDPAASRRQGTYPTGNNPFEDIPNQRELVAHASHLNTDRTVTPSRVQLKAMGAKTVAHGCSPVLEDWMDLAEESFT